jgi:hypothetical protein
VPGSPVLLNSPAPFSFLGNSSLSLVIFRNRSLPILTQQTNLNGTFIALEEKGARAPARGGLVWSW